MDIEIRDVETKTTEVTTWEAFASDNADLGLPFLDATRIELERGAEVAIGGGAAPMFIVHALA